jgi:hypothetical protein
MVVVAVAVAFALARARAVVVAVALAVVVAREMASMVVWVVGVAGGGCNLIFW